MPTSSQALNWLKQITDFSSPSSSGQLPDVFRYRYDDRMATETSPADIHHQSGEVTLLNNRQGLPGRLFENDPFQNCLPLPPIVTSSRQHSLSIPFDAGKSSTETHDGNLLPAINMKEPENSHISYDIEAQPNSNMDFKGNVASMRNSKEKRSKLQQDLECGNVLECELNTNDDHHLEEENQAEAETAAGMYNEELSDNGLDVPPSESIDLSFEAKNNQNDRASSSYYEDIVAHKPGCSFSKPNTGNKVDFMTETGLSQDSERDTKSKKPLLACVLNIHLRDHPHTSREDNSSCMGVLSYNHHMGRHVWNLVPQKIRTPRRVIRGRYIKKIISGENKTRTSYFEQMDKFSVRTLHQLSTMETDNVMTNSSQSIKVLQNGPGGITEVSYTTVTPAESSVTDKNEVNHMKNENHFYQCDSEHSTIDEINPVNSRYQMDEASSNDFLAEVSSCPQRNLYGNLKCSGIIENESYYFDEGDSVNVTPGFLETLTSAPKQRGQDVEYPSSYPWTSMPCHDFPYFTMDYSPRFKDKACEPVPRTFSGLTPTQKEKAKSKACKNSSVSRPDTGTPKELTFENPQMVVKSPTFVSSERQENSGEWNEQGIKEACLFPLTEAKICPSTESKVVRMRTELPPSHPNRLCFRTSISGCSHAEVITEIESQKNVKVIWLQYEPVSLHNTDVASADYRHVCMWLFELSSESDPSNLLLEGFTLRGQSVNVLHLDDVYMEEFRTFNICNEIYMEQRSKNLLKNKSRHFLKSARIV